MERLSRSEAVEGVTVLALNERDSTREEVDEALHLWEDLLAAGAGDEG